MRPTTCMAHGDYRKKCIFGIQVCFPRVWNTLSMFMSCCPYQIANVGILLPTLPVPFTLTFAKYKMYVYMYVLASLRINLPILSYIPYNLISIPDWETQTLFWKSIYKEELFSLSLKFFSLKPDNLLTKSAKIIRNVFYNAELYIKDDRSMYFP